jgi:hypothetical protein
MSLPEEDKLLYREWMLLSRHLDIQQKIHFKTNFKSIHK